MKAQRVLHQVVLLVLLVQLCVPFITIQPAQASPSVAPSTPLLNPQPLAPSAESALQQAPPPLHAPAPAPASEILPPGTIPAAAPLAQNLDQRVYLPLVVGGSGSAADPATERIDLRTRYAKVFQRPDGSGYALSYAAPIHYIDTAGAWADIDNTLVSDLQQQGVYQNAANDITVSIAADPDTAALQAGFNVAALSFAQGDTRFTLAPQTSRAVTGTVHGAITTFADIARDTALHYAPLADGVFIGVQLASRAATQQPITFDLTAPGLVLSHTDGLLQLTGDDAILTFSAVAIDARQRTGAVTVAVLDQGAGQYILTLEPDRDWLRTASPVFPISLELLGTSISTDPALAATSIQGVVEDTYAQQRFPTISTWNQARLYLGYDPPSGPNGANYKEVTRTYIQYGFPALPPGSTITSARAHLFQYFSQAGTYQTRVSRVVGQDWAPIQNDGNFGNDLTWNNQPSVIDERCCTTTDAGSGFKVWDITDYARAWQSGTPNYGILIQSANEGAAGGSIFWAANSGRTGETPYLQIDYTENPILSMQTDMSFAPGSTVAQGTDVTASFVVRNNGGGAYNGPIRANTGASPNFAEVNVGIGGLGGTYSYASTVRFNDVANYIVCAGFAGGNIPAGSGQPCRTLNVVTPADFQLDGALSVLPRSLPPEGGTATAQFTVINTSPSLPAEGRVRAFVKNSSVSFNETNSIRLNSNERSGYSESNFFSTPGVYEVEAQHLPLNESTWRPLIGQGSAILQILNPPPPPVEQERGYPPHCGTAGEPVNTSTGNFFADATDIQEPAVGLPMAATRWYNALDAADVAGPFGFGTAWMYDMRVTYRNDKSALIRMADGSVAYFLGDLSIGNPLDLAGTYIGQDEDIGTLVRAADATSILTLPDQTRYHFDANGRIVQVSHPHPSEITVAYSGTLPIALQHSAGITFTMTYSDGLISEIASSTGRSVQYTYANGDLVQVTRPDGAVYRYEYDANHRLTAAYTPNGNAYVRNFYDDQGRVVRQLDQDGSESYFTYGADITLPRIFTDTLGFTTTHFYDADYRLIREIDALGHTTTYTRDAQSNIIAKQDRTGAVWQWTYDTRSNMLTATDPLGNVTTYEYDARNNRTAMIDPLGHRTEYTYDASNRLIAERDALGHTRTFAYDSMGNLIFERDKTGGETRYLHNPQGLPISITNALGQTTLIAYDAFGNTAVYTDAEGRVATFAYDELNRLMDSSDPISASFPLAYDAMGNLLAETDALGAAMTYEYDAFDRITAQRDFRGNITTYAYDALGRTTAITNPLGETTRSVYDPVGNLVEMVAPDGTSTRYEYDPEQRLIRETDALGRTTAYIYDAAGRQIETREPCDPAVCPTGFAVERITYDAASRAIARQDARGAVTQTEYDALNRVARLIYPDGSSVAYSYDEAGRQIQEVDQVGAVTRIFYDDLGQPISTTTPLGFTTIMTFDAVGNVLAETNKRGATTTYTYDANDRPVAVTDALGNTTTTTYDAEGRMLSMADPLGRTTRYEYDANGNQTRQLDPRGNASTTEYDALDRPIRECDALNQCREMAYDDMGRMAAETDPLGRTTRYEYDDIGRKVREISPLGYTTIYTYDRASNLIATADATGAVTRYEYDPNGNRVRQIDPLGQVRRMEYDDLNRMTRMVDELGGVTTMTYDAKGRLIAQTDARGQTSTTTYDEQGRRIREVSPLGRTTVYTYNAMDSLIAMQDADGFVTTYEHDLLDREILQRDPLGATRATTYDAAGQTDVEVDYRGNPTSYAYDAAGNPVAVENALGDTATTTYDRLNRITATTDQLGHTSYTGYDALGRVISETTALGFTTVFTYNEEGWLIAQSDALGQTRTTTYDAVGRPLTVTDEAGRTTTYEYDPLGRKISETDALGRTMQMRYDAAGRVVQLIAPDGTTQSYSYDPLGNLLSETDANGNTTRYEYDADGRKIRKTDALGHVWLYQYDQRGNQTAVELPSGTLITMTYDDLGRMVELFYDGVREVTFGYDANGNRTFMDDRSGRTSYTYDALNRLIASGDGNNRSAAYGYDAVGQRISLTYPDGSVATYAYDADGRMVDVREPDSGASTTTYDALNRPALMRQANGVTIAYRYDPVGNLLEQTHRAPDGAIQTQHQYALNPVNQRTQMIELLPQDTITTTYTYDQLDRLLRSVSSDGRTTSYTFDKVGNRLLQTGTRQRAGITETYRIATDYNALNQLLRSSDSVLGDSFYRYDSDGYRTAMFAPDRRDTYTYNAEGRMLEALVEVLDADTAGWIVKGNTRERYTYDGLGRRVEREELNHSLNALRVRHEYRYDDGQIWDVLQSYRISVSDESSERRYLYNTAFHKLATTEDGATRYFQNDGLGSVTGATDSAGSLATPDTMRYDDYGNLLGDESALPTEDAYTGYERDAYTGLHYARNRYYDSVTGTFLTPDPYPANYSDMLDLHRYLYVQANPINNTDPLGLFLITSSTTGLIQWGDTLGAIARQLGTSIEHLLRLNPQITNRDLIYAGATLNIPNQQSASNYQDTVNQNAANQGTSGSYCGLKCDTHYTVASGDTLSGIGVRAGVPWEWIYKANRNTIGQNYNLIRPGQRFWIPCSDPGGSISSLSLIHI